MLDMPPILQVEQYASSVRYFKSFLLSVALCLWHDVIWTSRRVQMELKQYGLDAGSNSQNSFSNLLQSDSSSISTGYRDENQDSDIEDE